GADRAVAGGKVDDVLGRAARERHGDRQPRDERGELRVVDGGIALERGLRDFLAVADRERHQVIAVLFVQAVLQRDELIAKWLERLAQRLDGFVSTGFRLFGFA